MNVMKLNLPKVYKHQPFHLQKKAINIRYLLLFIYAYSLSMFLVDIRVTSRLEFVFLGDCSNDYSDAICLCLMA